MKAAIYRGLEKPARLEKTDCLLKTTIRGIALHICKGDVHAVEIGRTDALRAYEIFGRAVEQKVL